MSNNSPWSKLYPTNCPPNYANEEDLSPVYILVENKPKIDIIEAIKIPDEFLPDNDLYIGKYMTDSDYYIQENI